MRFRIWASAIAIIVLAVEGTTLALNWSHPSCPAGERIRMPMPFEHNGGQSWYAQIPELERLADNVPEIQGRSPIVICEDKRLLGPAHGLHKDITEIGRGRYSHWGPYLIFSTSDNSDPNENGRSYLAIRTGDFPAGDSPLPLQPVTIAKDSLLVDRKKKTLYTYDKDSNGKSACNGACAEIWLPYNDHVDTHNPDNSMPGNWSVIARDDGTKMWAYKGKPLYYYTGDRIPGDTNGHGIDGRWHAATSD